MKKLSKRFLTLAIACVMAMAMPYRRLQPQMQFYLLLVAAIFVLTGMALRAPRD